MLHCFSKKQYDNFGMPLYWRRRHLAILLSLYYHHLQINHHIEPWAKFSKGPLPFWLNTVHPLMRQNFVLVRSPTPAQLWPRTLGPVQSNVMNNLSLIRHHPIRNKTKVYCSVNILRKSPAKESGLLSSKLGHKWAWNILAHSVSLIKFYYNFYVHNQLHSHYRSVLEHKNSWAQCFV